MSFKIIENIKKDPYFLPVFVILITVVTIVLNFYLLLYNNTLIFDPLLFIPIILVAYCYPKRGVTATTWIAFLYFVTVALVPYRSQNILLSGIAHAAIFIIVGFTVSYFKIKSSEDLNIYKQLAEIVGPSKIKNLIFPSFIVILLAIIIFLNYFVLQISHSVMFDSLLFIPIIFVVYFYPKRGVTATTWISILYILTVILVPNNSQEILLTSITHAAIFIIAGFVISYLSISFSNEKAIYKRLAEIVVNSTVAITGETLDGTITDWNKGAENLYGYTSEEAVGKSILRLLPLDRFDEINPLRDKIQRGEHIERYETERITKQGRRIHVSLSISPIKNDRGNILGTSVIAHDITERKQLEDALRQTNRQHNLMTSITRHDILNKIFIMLGYFDILKSKQIDPEITPFHTKLESATKAIQWQIEFTRVYEDLGTHEPQWQELNKVIPRSEIPSSITLVTDLQGVEVYADPMLKIVFYNLLENTIKHGQKVTAIRIFYNHSTEGLTVIYEDNGIGIPTDEKEQIFDRGFGKNTGLGLFLVREILAITGINIRETGEPGKGVRFEIMITKEKYRFINISKEK